MSTDAKPLPAEEKLNWLKSQCNRYANGVCHTRGCLIRGGWKFEDSTTHTYEIATCIPHELAADFARSLETRLAVAEQRLKVAEEALNHILKHSESPPAEAEAQDALDSIAKVGGGRR